MSFKSNQLNHEVWKCNKLKKEEGRRKKKEEEEERTGAVRAVPRRDTEDEKGESFFGL